MPFGSLLYVSSLYRILAVIRQEHIEITVSVSSCQFLVSRTHHNASLSP